MACGVAGGVASDSGEMPSRGRRRRPRRRRAGRGGVGGGDRSAPRRRRRCCRAHAGGGRERAQARFAWPVVARAHLAFFETLTEGRACVMVPDVIQRVRAPGVDGATARQTGARHGARNARQVADRPPLRFRNGLVFHSGPGDSAGFLFFGDLRERLLSPRPGRRAGRRRRGHRRQHRRVHARRGVEVSRRDRARLRAGSADLRACCGGTSRRTASSSRVRIWNEAVAGESGTLRFMARATAAWSRSAHSAGARPRGGILRRAGRDAADGRLARTAGRVGVLKMDCEGAEADILEQAGAALDAVDYTRRRIPSAAGPRRACRGSGARSSRSIAVTAEDSRRCGPMIRAPRPDAPGGRGGRESARACASPSSRTTPKSGGRAWIRRRHARGAPHARNIAEVVDATLRLTRP